MFVVQLHFSDNKSQAPQYMQGHNAWIQRGFDDGVFLVTGSLAPGLGGAVVAHNTTLAALEARVKDDPFVAHNVVVTSIAEIAPSRTDARLEFLIGQ